jgi:pimeloyl-ACP methyl ester carboxylesterase
MRQPEVDLNRVTVLGHSEGTMIAPRVAVDNPDKVDNIVLMGAVDNQTRIFHSNYRLATSVRKGSIG